MMATTTLATMRQLEERQVENEINLMEWSPKMDIIAVGFFNGDVSLYRLNWQKLWTVSPPVEGAHCRSFAWRPDGKVLAVGYDDGELRLMDIESNVPIHTRHLDDSVSCLSWILCDVPKEEEPADSEWDFLTRFPSLSKAYSYNPSGGPEETEKCQKIEDGGMTSLLLSGTRKGQVSISINGYLHCVTLRLTDVISGGKDDEVDVISIVLSSDLTTFSVLCVPGCGGGGVKLMVFSMTLLATCLEELSRLSVRFSALDGMVSYMGDTLKQITEAWEGILVEMDTKLASYASKLPEDDGNCAMAADFLELLTFGTPSPDLEGFLLQELTEKGLKKLGGSIEVSYSNVQRLVLKYLHMVSQSVNYHLCELLGLIRANGNYSVLGITEESVLNAQRKAASFWMKGIELQQVIDESMKRFKAFFRWLYVEILRLSDEDISEELSKMSLQDVRYIAEFLDSFAPNDEKPRNMERVGQYLQDKDLTTPVDRSKNPWCRFLKENWGEFGDAKIPFVVQVNEEKSLVQEFKVLEAAVTSIFESVRCDMTDKSILHGEVDFPESAALKCGQFGAAGSNKIYGFVNIEEKLLVYELDPGSAQCSTKGLCLTFEKAGQKVRHASSTSATGVLFEGQMRLVDCQFYTSDTLSLLVQNEVEGEVTENQRMIQMSISDVDLYFKEIPLSSFRPTNVDDLLSEMKTLSVFNAAGQACHRELERISSIQFAVSGPRKVAAFLFKNKRRVRIYDMEIDEEEFEEDFDEENEIMGNSGLSSSELNTSM